MHGWSRPSSNLQDTCQVLVDEIGDLWSILSELDAMFNLRRSAHSLLSDFMIVFDNSGTVLYFPARTISSELVELPCIVKLVAPCVWVGEHGVEPEVLSLHPCSGYLELEREVLVPQDASQNPLFMYLLPLLEKRATVITPSEETRQLLGSFLELLRSDFPHLVHDLERVQNELADLYNELCRRRQVQEPEAGVILDKFRKSVNDLRGIYWNVKNLASTIL